MGEGSTPTVHGFGPQYDFIFGKQVTLTQGDNMGVNLDEMHKEDLLAAQTLKKEKKPKVPKEKKPKVKKANKPVTILLTPEMRDDKTVQEQVAGHKVIYTDDLPERPDVILGAVAWRILPPLYPFIKIAIKEARKLKYPKEEAPASPPADSGATSGTTATA